MNNFHGIITVTYQLCTVEFLWFFKISLKTDVLLTGTLTAGPFWVQVLLQRGKPCSFWILLLRPPVLLAEITWWAYVLISFNMSLTLWLILCTVRPWCLSCVLCRMSTLMDCGTTIQLPQATIPSCSNSSCLILKVPGLSSDLPHILRPPRPDDSRRAL